MLCAIGVAGIFALLMALFVLITKCCPTIQAKLIDIYESFVWSGIFRMLLQSFLILCFSMTTNIEDYVNGP